MKEILTTLQNALAYVDNDILHEGPLGASTRMRAELLEAIAGLSKAPVVLKPRSAGMSNMTRETPLVNEIYGALLVADAISKGHLSGAVPISQVQAAIERGTLR